MTRLFSPGRLRPVPADPEAPTLTVTVGHALAPWGGAFVALNHSGEVVSGVCALSHASSLGILGMTAARYKAPWGVRALLTAQARAAVLGRSQPDTQPELRVLLAPTWTIDERPYYIHNNRDRDLRVAATAAAQALVDGVDAGALLWAELYMVSIHQPGAGASGYVLKLPDGTSYSGNFSRPSSYDRLDAELSSLLLVDPLLPPYTNIVIYTELSVLAEIGTGARPAQGERVSSVVRGLRVSAYVRSGLLRFAPMPQGAPEYKLAQDLAQRANRDLLETPPPRRKTA